MASGELTQPLDVPELPARVGETAHEERQVFGVGKHAMRAQLLAGMSHGQALRTNRFAAAKPDQCLLVKVIVEMSAPVGDKVSQTLTHHGTSGRDGAPPCLLPLGSPPFATEDGVEAESTPHTG